MTLKKLKKYSKMPESGKISCILIIGDDRFYYQMFTCLSTNILILFNEKLSFPSSVYNNAFFLVTNQYLTYSKSEHYPVFLFIRKKFTI